MLFTLERKGKIGDVKDVKVLYVEVARGWDGTPHMGAREHGLIFEAGTGLQSKMHEGETEEKPEKYLIKG